MNRRDTILSLVLLGACGAAAWVTVQRRVDADPAPPVGCGPPAESAAAPRAPSRPSVTGRVVAAEGGDPIGGARVVVVVPGAPGGTLSWLASDTSRDGTFDVPLGSAVIPPGSAVEVRVRAEGRPPWRGTVTAGTGPDGATSPVLALAQDVRLERLTRELVPGRIAVRAVDADGRRVAGPVSVQGFDEFLAPLERCAMADADGAFVLEGVPAGRWSLALAEADARTDVEVGEGGEAQVTLRSRARQGAEPAPTDLARLLADMRAVERQARELEDAAKTATDEFRRADVARDLAEARRRFEAMRRTARRALPHRDAVFRGAPGGRRAWIAAPGDDGTWVVEMRPAADAPDGTLEARIPRLPVGMTRIEVRLLDALDDAFEVEIVEGDGPQVVALPAR